MAAQDMVEKVCPSCAQVFWIQTSLDRRGDAVCPGCGKSRSRSVFDPSPTEQVRVWYVDAKKERDTLRRSNIALRALLKKKGRR